MKHLAKLCKADLPDKDVPQIRGMVLKSEALDKEGVRAKVLRITDAGFISKMLRMEIVKAEECSFDNTDEEDPVEWLFFIYCTPYDFSQQHGKLCDRDT